MRAVILFMTLFPVLILRKADLHGVFQPCTRVADVGCSPISPSFHFLLHSVKRNRFFEHFAYYRHLFNFGLFLNMFVSSECEPDSQIDSHHFTVFL